MARSLAPAHGATVREALAAQLSMLLSSHDEKHTQLGAALVARELLRAPMAAKAEAEEETSFKLLGRSEATRGFGIQEVGGTSAEPAKNSVAPSIAPGLGSLGPDAAA